MARRVRRLAAVSGCTAVVLLAAATASLWSISSSVPYLMPYVLAASLLLAAVGLLPDRRWLLVPGIVVAVGAFAVFGGLVANGAICLQPLADGWSITYDWRANVIQFGPTFGGGYLCRAEPIRSLVVTGYLLVSAGAYELSIGRVEGPLTGLFEWVRKQWSAEN